MHSVQADGTLCSPHVETHSETMWDVVVHSLFHAAAKLYNKERGDLSQRQRNMSLKCFYESF